MSLPPATTIVYALTVDGVRTAALVTRRHLRGRGIAKVWLRGQLAPVTLDACQVFDREADARRHWRQARMHQMRLERAGARIRTVDAHLSLAYAEASYGAQLVA